MNYGTIKRIGNGQVDIQVTGSAGIVRNARISAQVDWRTLTVGTRVLVGTVDGLPVVLHTITDLPTVYATEEQTYAGSGVTGGSTNIGNALLADGSVALTGDLPVAPGIKVDGYDISTLGQTIDNLQAADSVARTGYTVLTHASHIVESVSAADTQIKIRHDLFADKETLTVSNTNGEVENMKVIGEAVATVDNRGVICYLYTVTRRVSTSPAGLVTGWAAATLVNGLTDKGYIAFDARENRSASPSMRFVLHTDIDAGATEHIVRAGSLNGILDYTDEDYGFAIGRLTTTDKFLAYSYIDNRFRIRNADIGGENETGTETFRIWGTNEGAYVPGDYRFGPAGGGHQEWTSERQRLSFFNGPDEVMYFSPTESRFKNMIWAGDNSGPQIGIGELNGEGTIIARNSLDVAQFIVRTRSNTDGVYVFAGNPKPQGNWIEVDNGLTVDGTIKARAMEIIGQVNMSETSEILIRDPADPRRYGHIKPHFLAGYSVDGNNVQYLSSLIAWAPTVLEAQPGSNVWRTWIAGEAFFGDWRYSHFRVERNGRVGMFNGDTPKAYLDTQGNAYLTGSLIFADGKGVADATGISHTEGTGSYWQVKPDSSLFMEINSSGSANTYNGLRVTEDTGIAGYYSGGYIGLYAKSTTGEIGVFGFSEVAATPPGKIPDFDAIDPDKTDGIEALGLGTSVYGLTFGATAGRFVASGGGRGVVGVTDDANLAGVVARNTGGGPALTVETSYAYLEAGLIVNATGGGTGTVCDTRIAGDTDTHLIFVDASLDRVGISESAPNTTLDVNGTTRLGDSDTNYAQFAADGSLTMHGTATLTSANGIISPLWKPSADSTTALQIQYSWGGVLGNIDTTNGKVGIGTTAPASRLDIDAGALTMKEMTAPAAPAANSVVIYAEDDGSGKTRLMALFPSGAAKQIEIEP